VVRQMTNNYAYLLKVKPAQISEDLRVHKLHIDGRRGDTDDAALRAAPRPRASLVVVNAGQSLQSDPFSTQALIWCTRGTV
jgi:hypothetical protein